MKILVPIDFSKCSVNASEYAADLAKKLKSEIILLNVSYLPGVPHASMLVREHLENTIMENAKQDCLHLLQQMKERNKDLELSYNVVEDHNIVQVIENYAHHHDIDYIIMGSQGASGLSKALLGSTTAAVITNSTIPVIAVPPHIRFNGIKNIVYASDLLNIHKEIKLLIHFAALFKARINIVHILPPDSKKKINKSKLTRELSTALQYSKISVHIFLNNDIEDGIEEFFIEQKGDILVMFTHDLSFFQKLFGKSSTRELAFKSSVPLLTFKKHVE